MRVGTGTGLFLWDWCRIIFRQTVLDLSRCYGLNLRVSLDDRSEHLCVLLLSILDVPLLQELCHKCFLWGVVSPSSDRAGEYFSEDEREPALFPHLSY